MLYEELQQDAQVAELLKKGNRDLGVLGFTDHSVAHTTLVAERAAYILRKLGYSEREQELAWMPESFVEIEKVFPMFRLSIDGLKDGMYKLMRGN